MLLKLQNYNFAAGQTSNTNLPQIDLAKHMCIHHLERKRREPELWEKDEDIMLEWLLLLNMVG